MGKSVEEIRAELEAAEAAEAAATEQAVTAAETDDMESVTVTGFKVEYSDGTVVEFAPVVGDGVAVDPSDPVDAPATDTDVPAELVADAEVPAETEPVGKLYHDTVVTVTTTEDINPGADATAVADAQ